MNKLQNLLRVIGEQNSKDGQDSILAHINPHEAALLKLLGGSGRIDPITGGMHFESEDGPSESGGDPSSEDGYNGPGGDQAQASDVGGWNGGYQSDADAYASAGLANGPGPQNSFDDFSMAQSMGQNLDGSWGNGTENLDDDGSGKGREGSAFDKGQELADFGEWSQAFGKSVSEFFNGPQEAGVVGDSAYNNGRSGTQGQAYNASPFEDNERGSGTQRGDAWDDGTIDGSLTNGWGANAQQTTGPDEQSIGVANSGRGSNQGGLGTATVNEMATAYEANPGAWNAANNSWSPGANSVMQGPSQGWATDFANWASREGIYSQPGAGAPGVLDSIGTNFGDPHSANANAFQSFITHNGLQGVSQWGVPLAASLLAGPLGGTLASIGLNAAKGDNITSQLATAAGGFLGGPLGSTVGNIVGNAVEGRTVDAINAALNAGLHYGGVNLGSNIGQRGSIGNDLATMVGSKAQSYATNYAARGLSDLIDDARSSPVMGDLASEAYGGSGGSDFGASYAANDGDGSFSLADYAAPSYAVMGGGGGPSDNSEYSDFIGSLKKSRYKRPNALLAILEGDHAA